MVTLKITNGALTDIDYHYLRDLVGFYRGSVHFSDSGIISIVPSQDFNLNGLLLTLRSIGFSVEKI